MREKVPYDQSRHPPVPVLSLRLSRVGSDRSVVLTAVVDTGADMTVIPQRIARELRLPFVRQVQILGAGGAAHRATVNSAEVEIAGFRDILEVVAVGQEVLIGRDLLNRWVVMLHGPDRTLQIM